MSNVLFAVAAVSRVALVVSIARKGDDAIVPVSALKDRNTLVFSGVNFMYNFGSMSLSFFIPGFIMTTLTDDPLVGILGGAFAGGLALSIRAVPGLFLGPFFGKMIAKNNSAKGALMIGNIFRLIVIVCLVLFLVPGVPVWVIYVLMVLAGIFTSQHSVTMSAGPQIQLRPQFRTIGNSVIQLSQNLGGSVGTAVFTLMVSADAAAGMHMCMVATLIAWVLLAIISFFMKASPESVADSE